MKNCRISLPRAAGCDMIKVAFGNLRRRLHGRAEPRDKEVFMYLSEFIESLALYGLPAVVMSVLAEGCTVVLSIVF